MTPRQQWVLNSILSHLENKVSKTRTDEAESNGEATKTKRKPDGEIQMMARIDRLLSTLDAAVQTRIVGWLAARQFGGTWTMEAPKEP